MDGDSKLLGAQCSATSEFHNAFPPYSRRHNFHKRIWPNKNERLIHTDAQFISQEHVTVFFGSLQVKVKFTAIKPRKNVITYVYPADRHRFKKQSLIPVTYLTSQPSNAYYAGPGGDANSSDFVGVPFIKTLGAAAVLIGLVLILQQLNWRVECSS